MKFSEKTVSLLYAVPLIVVTIIVTFTFDLTKYSDFAKRQFNKAVDKITNEAAMLLGPPTPTPYVYHEPTAEQKAYLIALGAIISTYNNENTDTLMSNHDSHELSKLIEEYWEITDRESAIILLDWLELTGHRAEYSEMVDLLVRKNITACRDLQEVAQVYGDERDQLCRDEDIRKLHDFYAEIDERTKYRTLYAWDYGRLVNVARWSYSLGYISQEEAWQYIVPAAIQLQSTYHSWDDYGQNYLAGRDFWLQETEVSQDMERVFERLIDPESNSVWMTVNWNTHID